MFYLHVRTDGNAYGRTVSVPMPTPVAKWLSNQINSLGYVDFHTEW